MNFIYYSYSSISAHSAGEHLHNSLNRIFSSLIIIHSITSISLTLPFSRCLGVIWFSCWIDMTICTVHGFFSRCCSLKVDSLFVPKPVSPPLWGGESKGALYTHCLFYKRLRQRQKGPLLLLCWLTDGVANVRQINCRSCQKKKKYKLKDQFEKPAQLATASLCGRFKCAVKLNRTLPGSSHICAAYEIDVTFE